MEASAVLRPQTPSRADLWSPKPRSITEVRVARRIWSGVCIDVTQCWGRGESCNLLGYEGETRLWALLEEAGGAHCEARFRENQPSPVSYTPRNMHFAPAGMAAWGYSADLGYIRDATLVFDFDDLEARWEERFDAQLAAVPRWRFADDDLWNLTRQLASAVGDPDPTSQLYGDGLVTAILARFARGSSSAQAKNQGLARWQLRRVLEFLDAQFPKPVQLSSLASLTGLSQAHFARAFKASTGCAPYQWQLRSRIDRAKALMLQTSDSLDDIAAATGFADAAHFGRTFRRMAGTTPAHWRLSHKR